MKYFTGNESAQEQLDENHRQPSVHEGPVRHHQVCGDGRVPQPDCSAPGPDTTDSEKQALQGRLSLLVDLKANFQFISFYFVMKNNFG